ncbi:MAG: pyridoxamine 5'-phosphate oxidase family protein [Anaerolineales bacterium]|nr:pyridoxamine 5'-phosphate oxidase family protein [Anaerolineales bacterium]
MALTLAALTSFLAAHSTLTLATAGPDGGPSAASLFFAADEAARLYWVSAPSTHHSRNLAADPRAAVTISAATWQWAEIAGVQMEGAVRALPHGAEWQAAWALYEAKFPFAAQFAAELSRADFYVLTPRWARLIDNGRGFGHKDELTFSP